MVWGCMVWGVGGGVYGEGWGVYGEGWEGCMVRGGVCASITVYGLIPVLMV